MRWFLIVALTLAAPAWAQDCGAPDAPCQTASGGDYHIALAEGEPGPVVVFLHGFGGRAAKTIANRGLMKPMLERGYSVIAPQGMPFRANSKGGAWNSFANPQRRDDVAFLREVADDAAARFGVDRARMLIGGFSGGGMMTWRVACDAPDSFAAYAPIAGLLWRPLPEACAGPIRLHHTHGWSDPVVPVEGRTVGNGFATQGDLFTGLNLLRKANRCVKDDPDEYSEEGVYLSRKWTSCVAGSALEMALHPGGHSIPKGWSKMALTWFEGLSAETSN
ncbi:MAG: alpha/beta fold hydrolase [Pseudomonadota bacterium]